jgi:hypothetical protein
MITSFWFILLFAGIIAILGILSKDPKTISLSFLLIGVYLIFGLIDIIGTKLNEGNNPEKIANGIINIAVFIFKNIKTISISVVLIAIILGIITLFRNFNTTNSG